MSNLISRLALASLLVSMAAGASAAELYNTVKKKLQAGEQVVGGTIYTSDPNIYCSMAEAGFDFLWIEMQHSALSFSEVERMIWACKDAPAIPFIRIPSANAGDIQKATDIGALGIVLPMVDDVQQARDAVMYAKYPPHGKRSRGGGQYGFWSKDYRATANENMMVVVMIESPAGVDIIDEVAAVEGVDVVFAASGDLGSFTGWSREDPRYLKLVERIHDGTLKAGKYLAGPLAWKDRHGFTFFQGPSEGSLIRSGAKTALTGTGGDSGKDVATGDEAR